VAVREHVAGSPCQLKSRMKDAHGQTRRRTGLRGDRPGAQ
jgi:hypothetical protein